jgi:hypothetical protein
VATAIKKLIADHCCGDIDAGDPLWQVRPLIDFATTKTAFGGYLWEREWRDPGGLASNRKMSSFFSSRRSSTRKRSSSSLTLRLKAVALPTSAHTSKWDREKIAESLRGTPTQVDPSPQTVAAQMGIDWR